MFILESKDCSVDEYDAGRNRRLGGDQLDINRLYTAMFLPSPHRLHRTVALMCPVIVESIDYHAEAPADVVLSLVDTTMNKYRRTTPQVLNGLLTRFGRDQLTSYSGVDPQLTQEGYLLDWQTPEGSDEALQTLLRSAVILDLTYGTDTPAVAE